MKNKREFGKHHVPTDETYIENINLITGAKFNYDRPLSTDRQIKQLCIDQQLNQVQKFSLLISEGENIQKWSILQNLHQYIHSQKEAQRIFEILSKNYAQITDLLPIMGDGITHYLFKSDHKLTKKISQNLYKMVHRTLTQYPNHVEDWITVLEAILKYGSIELSELKQFINNSFDMNSPPERRKVALMMMEKLFEYSKDIQLSSRSKVLFFNHDQNSKVRQTICLIMQKILIRNHEDEEIWKSIWQYYHDKDKNVKAKAIHVLSKIYHKKNFCPFYEIMDSQEEVGLFVDSLKDFLKTFKEQIKTDGKSKVKIIYFCNRIFRSKDIVNIGKIFSMFEDALLPVLGEGKIAQQVHFLKIDLVNKENIGHFANIYHLIQEVEFKEQIKLFLMRNLKQIKYQILTSITKFTEMLDLKQQQDISVYYLVAQKLFQKSKWYLLKEMLENFDKIMMYKAYYDRFCVFIMKIWIICPSFIMETVIDCIIFLMLSYRKSLQFMITVREKMLSSRSWSHRKNYLYFYAQLKKKCSFDFNKLIPILPYKNIVNDKVFGVKLAFLSVAPDILQLSAQISKFLDPVLSNEKTVIKETIMKLKDDKDMEVKESSIKTEEIINKIEKDGNWLHQLYERNRELLACQESIEQVISDPKKTVKTQNDIKKNFNRRVYQDKKKTINLPHDLTQKQLSSIDVLNELSKSSQTKRVNLFRCHSVKIKVPNKKK